MALVKYGGGIVGASGSIAGNTHARNRFGNYIRARTKPVNPNTARQVIIRSVVSALTTRWAHSLTRDQQIAWNLYASSVAMKNRLGETIYLTGMNHYVRSNSFLSRHGYTIVDDAPTIFDLPDKDPLFSFTASQASQTYAVVFNTNLAWVTEDGGFMELYCGKPQTPQRNFFGGPWRNTQNLVGTSTDGPASPFSVPAVFAISVPQHLWMYARIRRADGRLSAPFYANDWCG